MGCGHRPKGALGGMRVHALRAAAEGRWELQGKGAAGRGGRGAESRGGAASGCTLRAFVCKEKADKFPYS